MILKNVSKNTILTKELKEAKSLVDQLLGLIKKSNPRSLFFKSHFGIHTFLLKESIDVVILDSNFKVVKLKVTLKPNRLFFWNIKYFLVLELPIGTIEKSQTSIDDQLSFSSVDESCIQIKSPPLAYF